MEWLTKEIVLDNQLEDTKISIIFEATSIIYNVRDISSSCGCATPKINGNKVEVKYDTGFIPFHLIPYGKYESAKSITIIYNDDTFDVLTFQVTTIKK